MEERRMKAYGFNATLEFIDKNYREEERQQIYGSLSPAVRNFIPTAGKAQWAPPEYSGELWTGVVKQHPNGDDARRRLVEVGRHMGAYATNTYLKLLMKMLTMKMFAKKFPDIWQRDANFGKVVVGDLDEIDGGRLRVLFKDLGTYPFFGPITQGWFNYSFEMMGLKDLKVELLEWSMAKPDQTELSYQITWTR